jgi:hypothetical protein
MLNYVIENIASDDDKRAACCELVRAQAAPQSGCLLTTCGTILFVLMPDELPAHPQIWSICPAGVTASCCSVDVNGAETTNCVVRVVMMCLSAALSLAHVYPHISMCAALCPDEMRVTTQAVTGRLPATVVRGWPLLPAT